MDNQNSDIMWNIERRYFKEFLIRFNLYFDGISFYWEEK